LVLNTGTRFPPQLLSTFDMIVGIEISFQKGVALDDD